MEVDSPSQPNNNNNSFLSPQDQILLRLEQCGVGEEYLTRLQLGLVDYVKENRSKLPEIVFAILPTDENLSEAYIESKAEHEEEEEEEEDEGGPDIQDLLCESFKWLQWLMFENEPEASLKGLSEINVRGVCGSVWGQSDLAYRCRTCENDSTCAICVPCFQNGDHKNHDYSIIYTGGGCCDCGDVTAWKREGFCSNHKGTEQIIPLSEEIAKSVGPVVDLLLMYWREKLQYVQNTVDENVIATGFTDECRWISNDLTESLVEMFLDFCKFSESLLSFISTRVFSSVGLLDVLVSAERFLKKKVVKKLHELLLKLLGEPTFKYEFAKVFIKHYPYIIEKAIKKADDNILEEYPLLSTFSVQIFTVPTLTSILVKEMNLLDILLGCIVKIFYHCVGEEGHIQVGKWAGLYETTVRLVEDTRFAMSHADVAKYITHEQLDISRTWVRALSFVQGMNPQKRVTGVHVEEEDENTHMPFVLGNSIANINSLLVAGTFSGVQKDDVDNDGLSNAKVGKLYGESSECSTAGRSNSINADDYLNHLTVPYPVKWLTCECLRAVENWLASNSVFIDPQSFSSQHACKNGSKLSALKKTICRISKGKSVSNRPASSKIRSSASSDFYGRIGALPSHGGFGMCSDPENEQSRIAKNTSLMGTEDMDVEYSNTCRNSDEYTFGADCGTESETLGALRLSHWPDINSDVSSQDISVHIPLHRLLAMLIQKTMNRFCGGSEKLEVSNSISDFPSSGCARDFFGWILGGCHAFGFSAYIMEHPLCIRVFCAQVRAGMWRKNGDAAILSCEWYRSVRWSEQGLELDLFLLQCCAALAPPELYVKRILDRFGLSNYLGLSLERSNEYEPILLHEMLTLIIQIVKERRFCGHSITEILRRELIYKLVIGDATRSQLVKSLPHGLSKNEQFQNILDTVAVYSKPSEMKQGKYSLRKTYWKELDLYHPRWNSRDLQIAEERYLQFCKVSALAVQLPHWTNVFVPMDGISRIATCRTILEIVRTVVFYAVCTDKPSSSRAPDDVLITALHLLSLSVDICQVQMKFSEQLCSTSGGMEGSLPVMAFAVEDFDIGASNSSDSCESQSLLSLLVSLMTRHRMESVNNFSEAGQSDLYSIIRSLLKRFAELDVGCMTKLKTLSPEVVCHLLPPIMNSDVHTSDSISNIKDFKAKARQRQAAILEKMRAEQSKFMDNIKSSANEEVDVSTPSEEVYISEEDNTLEESLVCSLCRDPNSRSPVYFMVLLQKSRLASFVERGPPSWGQVNMLEKDLKSKTKEEVIEISGSNILPSSSAPLVQLVQSAVDEFSCDALPGEVDAFLDFIKARLPAAALAKLPSTSHEESMCFPSLEMLEDNIYESIQKNMQNTWLRLNVLKDFPNISQVPTGTDLNDSHNIESVLLGKYLASLSRETSEQPLAFKIARNDNAYSNTYVQLASFDGFGPTNCDGIHISSCGHVVHQECRARYLSSLRERYNRRIVFEGVHVVDPDQGEFLCPVCRRLANSILPTFPGKNGLAWRQMMLSDLNSEVSTDFSTTPRSHVLHLSKALSLLQSAASIMGKRALQVSSLPQNKRMQPHLEPVLNRLCKMYFPDRYDKNSESNRVSHSMIFWDTLKYSLISTEIAARGGRSTLSTGGSASGIEALYKELESSPGFILSLLLQVAQSTRSDNFSQVLLRFRALELFKESICFGTPLEQFSTDKGHKRGCISYVLKHADKGITYPDIQFWKRATDPVIGHDPFSSLMWILYSLPRPFLSSVESLLYLIHLLYVVCVTQALVTCCGNNELDLSQLGFGDCLIGDICKIKGGSIAAQQYFVSHSIDSSCPPKDVIRLLTHPYLRRCALLWKLLKVSKSAPISDRSPQWNMLSLNRSSDISQSNTGLSVELTEIEELEHMFQIPDLDSVLKDKELHALSLKWLHHFCKESEVRSYGQLHLSPAVPFRLINLPHIYQDLLERYIKQQCPECERTMPDPALCLLCGTLCSTNWKSCCRGNLCHGHALACGAGIGVFLWIRKTTILLQRTARHAPWPSLYLDAFGEEDIDMHRGRPLYLNQERYAALTHMVASHGLDQSSEVLRQTTVDTLFLI